MSILLLALVLLVSPYLTIYLSGTIYDNRIRNEVFGYVIENKDSIELTDPDRRQYFEYYEWGFVDVGIIYGYFYSPYEECQDQTKDYRNGYLKYGAPYSGKDWCYFEKICDNWYYYEEHYG